MSSYTYASDPSGSQNQQNNSLPISDYFGEATFSLKQMRERMPRESYLDLLKCLDQGRKMTLATADAVAQAVKEWSVARGVTHFCHWFQPMTGLTAEKHEAFISIQHTNYSELSVLECFSGDQLVQGEPDASSFPSGGMRTTFEARGYTAWDPTSPLFIIDDAGSKTLCIPSIFFGYHGEALDNKTPLLRSAQTLSKELCKFLKLIGDVDVKKISPTLGAEQEYFLIDKEVAMKRPDIIATGRTVIGALSKRGQKLEDHYFGSIPSRVKGYMVDLERELYRLGVPVKARHNEVAPGQFELAPIFENLSVSADHNTLAMETMKRVALRHGLVCLLHEKPFAGVNGSGKHCNWSISNDKGENLLEPGRTPHQNLRFLAIISIVVKALNDHAGVLVAQISSPGNSLRLGGNEAPPTILSVFLGSMLESILETISKGDVAVGTEQGILDLGVTHIPNISKDYTDRNRTSPFAFTGNKFEFRAVGSSANVSVPMATLNAAVTSAAKEATERLKGYLDSSKTRDEAIVLLVKNLIEENKNVLFSGDNYSKKWLEEAANRGLPKIEKCSDAIEVMRDSNATKFLVDATVLTSDEIISRVNISLNRYVTTKSIEMQTLSEMINIFVVPAVEKQLHQSHSVLVNARATKLQDSLSGRVAKLESILNSLIVGQNDLEECLDKVEELDTDENKMNLLDNVASFLTTKLRESADSAESIIADEFWSLPKYRDLLFHGSMN
jgi:glutamine synthetase